MSEVEKRTRAEIGRSSRQQGIRAERAVAAYLREHGWPDAERMVSTGWRAGGRERADTGDIGGIWPLVVQVKSTGNLSTRDVARTLDDVDVQTIAAGGDYGVLVQRRHGKSDVGEWWAYTRVRELVALVETPDVAARQRDTSDEVVRLRLAGLVSLLQVAGYGGKT